MPIVADASQIPHQPTTRSDWTDPNKDVDGKLDELASRLKTEEARDILTGEHHMSLVSLATAHAF